MALGDTPQEPKLQDHFPAPTAFVVVDGEFNGIIQTTFGPREGASLQVRDVAGGEVQLVNLWGRMAKQVEMMTDEDKGKAFRLEQVGNGFLLREAPDATPGIVPSGEPAQPTQAEQQLGLGGEPPAVETVVSGQNQPINGNPQTSPPPAVQPPPASAQHDPTPHQDPTV